MYYLCICKLQITKSIGLPISNMNRINHEGIIKSIDDKGIHVQIVQMAACAACKVASQCQMSDKKEKMVDVDDPGTAKLSVGDKVVVYTDESMGFKAVAFAFLVPFVILVGVLVAVLAITHNEAWAALAGIIALVPYYFWLFIRKDTIKKQFQFKLETNQ